MIQTSDEEAPVTDDQVPVEQNVHDAAPPADQLPASHLVHAAIEVAPLTNDENTAEQLIHWNAEVASEVEDQDPALQEKH